MNATESSGNVFLDLGFSAEQASIRKVRFDLMNALEDAILENKWTQVQAAERLGIDRPRVSDLMRGKSEKFSVEALLTFSAKLGMQPKITLYKPKMTD